MLCPTTPLAPAGIGGAKVPDAPARRARLLSHLKRGLRLGYLDPDQIARAANDDDRGALDRQATHLTERLRQRYDLPKSMTQLPGASDAELPEPDAMARWLTEAYRIGLIRKRDITRAIKQGDQAVLTLCRHTTKRLQHELDQALTDLGPPDATVGYPAPRLQFQPIDHFPMYHDQSFWTFEEAALPRLVEITTDQDQPPALAAAVQMALDAIGYYITPVLGPDIMRDCFDGCLLEEARGVIETIREDTGVETPAQIDPEVLMETAANEYGVPPEAVDYVLYRESAYDARRAAMELTGQPALDADRLRRAAAPFAGNPWADWLYSAAFGIERVTASVPQMSLGAMNYLGPTHRVIMYRSQADSCDPHLSEMINSEDEMTEILARNTTDLRSALVRVAWAVKLIDQAEAAQITSCPAA